MIFNKSAHCLFALTGVKGSGWLTASCALNSDLTLQYFSAE